METIHIVNKSHHPLPSYETPGSAGMDIRAFISEPIRLKPMERKLIPTGLFVSIPKGFEGQIRPRSGLSIRHGVTLINCVGTIDSDYRGEVKIPLINLSQEVFLVEDGMRIAQFVLAAHGTVEWSLTEDLQQTTRGNGGFGSTGHL